MSNLPPNRHPFEVQALHLRSYPYGEADLIVVLLTREYGLMRAIARGVRKARSRMSGLISPLRCNRLQLTKGRNLHSISQAESIHAFSGLQQDYDRLMVGMGISELISRFCQEEDAMPEFYDALLSTLEVLNQSEQPRDVLLWFMLYFLENQGYYQDWLQCQTCDQVFTPLDVRFQNVLDGGLRCRACKQGPDHRILSPGQAQALISLQQAQEPARLDLPAKELNGLIWNLQTQLQHLAGQELRCFAFLHPQASLPLPAIPPSSQPI
ncbi:MAG: DNA repair protein RecO [Candidatus Melainabacteria bacterium HGW-Melainabacteria-1]|nr:MAG: DNA repair protein RecO [Candidatus Melainabacteria bacterium HGW-Melainabacteria-1]